MEKKNHVILSGEVIRIMEEYAEKGELYFYTEVTETGRYIAHGMNGKVRSAFPTDTIEYIRTCGHWWEVKAVHCQMAEIEKNNGEITYDIEEAPPCCNCFLEDEYHRLQG